MPNQKDHTSMQIYFDNLECAAHLQREQNLSTRTHHCRAYRVQTFRSTRSQIKGWRQSYTRGTVLNLESAKAK